MDIFSAMCFCQCLSVCWVVVALLYWLCIANITWKFELTRPGRGKLVSERLQNCVQSGQLSGGRVEGGRLFWHSVERHTALIETHALAFASLIELACFIRTTATARMASLTVRARALHT